MDLDAKATHQHTHTTYSIADDSEGGILYITGERLVCAFVLH